MDPRSARTAVVAAATAGVAAVLLALVALADVRWLSGSGAGQVALDTAAATIGLLLALLVYGRYLETRLQGDALLCAALLVLACGNAVLSVVPVVFAGTSRLSSAAALSGLAAGGLFAAAVWVRPVAVPLAGRAAVPLQLAAVTAFVLTASWGASRLLPRSGTGSPDTFGASSDAFLTAVQLAAAAAFAVAAVGWCRPQVQGEIIAPPLAAACVMGAASRLAFAVADEPGSAWATAGTAMRLAFYATLVGATVLQVKRYWRKAAEAAVLEERRRIARNLHDGLAQELAFTATQARALAERSDNPTRALLVAGAAERALDESRRAIAALTQPIDEPLEVALAKTAEDVCARFDATLVLHVDPGASAAGDTREALLRIVREAVSNAVRHGSARSVTVRLTGGSPVRLCVEDDGTGFDVSDPRHLSGRFGLQSMRERAEALGGTFRLSSRSPGGTTVEVVLP